MTEKAILLSTVVASVSFFISHSQLLDKTRQQLLKRSTFFGLLVTCPYCLGHWIAMPLVIALQIKLFNQTHGMIDFFLTWLAISWLAGLQSLLAAWLWGE